MLECACAYTSPLVDSLSCYGHIATVVRHATEVHFMYENQVEYAVNAVFEVNSDSSMLRIADMVPESASVLVRSFRYKILLPSGRVLLKEKVRKSRYDSVMDFMPISYASEYFTQGGVLLVEVDFRLLLTEVDGAIVWPNFDGVAKVGEVSFRLLWDSPLLFTKTSNIDAMAESGVSDGCDYLLWRMVELSSGGGVFDGGLVANPSLELVQKGGE